MSSKARIAWILTSSLPLVVVASIYWTDERRPRLLSGDETSALVTITGWTCLAMGVFFCCINSYLSFLRYPLHRLLRGEAKYSHVSGFPFMGTVFVVIGSMILPPSIWKTTFAVLLLLVDTGGPLWFIIGMLLMEFWPAKAE